MAVRAAEFKVSAMDVKNDVKNGKVYGCYCDLLEGETPEGCVIDSDDHASCTNAITPSGRLRRSKWTCSYWKPFRKAEDNG